MSGRAGGGQDAHLPPCTPPCPQSTAWPPSSPIPHLLSSIHLSPCTPLTRCRPGSPLPPSCRLSDQRVEALQECGAVTSIHLSPCGSFLLANLSDSQVHVWALPPGLAGGGGGPGRGGGGGGGGGGAYRSPGGADPLDALPSAPLHELRMGGAKPSRYVLRACVGGARAGFVACGAEDCSIYVWSRRSGELLQSLPGHAGCCNAVAWHPTNPWLMASASDDGTVRTWVAPAALRGS